MSSDSAGPTDGAGPGPAATLRPAATVALLRDAPAGLETWLLRRVRQMAFAAGMTVFPGGRVDEQDAASDVPWVGPVPDELARRLGVPVADARASVIAGVRETFEETGVLLTCPPHGSRDPLPGPAGAGGLDELRRGVETGQLSFARLLGELELSVDAGLIRAWARWLTPAAEKRRYDTCFYVAALPNGARTRLGTTEAEHAQWMRPTDAIAEHEAGSRPLLPPTVVMLRELSAFATVAEVLAAAAGRTLEPIQPDISIGADGVRTATLPDGRSFRLS